MNLTRKDIILIEDVSIWEYYSKNKKIRYKRCGFPKNIKAGKYDIILVPK